MARIEYEVREREATRDGAPLPACVLVAEHPPGTLARVHYQIQRTPAAGRVSVFHYEGSTPEERVRALRVANHVAKTGRLPKSLERIPGMWKRQKIKTGRFAGRWGFLTMGLGYPVDVDREFWAVAEALTTNGPAVDGERFPVPDPGGENPEPLVYSDGEGLLE